MTGRSGRGRWERVEAARRQARAALGRDPSGGDLFTAPPKARSPLPPPRSPTWVPAGPGVRVLFVQEAATRLGITPAELEAMIARGQVQTLPIEFGCVVPTREVERLQRAGT
jgi:hypothetical protein